MDDLAYGKLAELARTGPRQVGNLDNGAQAVAWAGFGLDEGFDPVPEGSDGVRGRGAAVKYLSLAEPSNQLARFHTQ